ncbi:MAG TPA: Fis family transcriptional regulator [Desulfobacterales bacterium]|nr:MAG: Fis family transcriptional regulator [Deltaproteobacteria bacterium]HHC23986.1 Fis family transcriptional regulator [Desulfobacterales bacterium]
MTDKNVGDSFEDFLEEQGLLEECTETAVRRVLAFQIEQMMKEKKLSKTAMAGEMCMSRTSLSRFLDPENQSVTLETIKKAASVLGRKIRFELA